MKSLAIIGSTGSIGKNSLNVFKKNRSKFDLVFLAAYQNIDKLIKQKNKYKPKKIFLLNESIYKKNKNKVSNIKYLYNFKKNKKIDYIISGASGFGSIKINFELLKLCKNLLIANKETIICGGKIFLDEAKRNNCKILPIDSEHHCIDFFLKKTNETKDIKTLYITASGGPFFNKKIKFNEKISNVMKHPNWNMGKNITVDSSTFSNKVLEIFEAKILFNIPADKIKIIVEQKSNVHAVIVYNNNIVIHILHKPSMEIPILNSLNLTNNFLFDIDSYSIKFHKPNFKKFPIIPLGYKILNEYGHPGMILFTVINQRLVEKYLNSEIKYGEIAKTLVNVFRNKNVIKQFKQSIKNYKDIINAIENAKKIKI